MFVCICVGVFVLQKYFFFIKFLFLTENHLKGHSYSVNHTNLGKIWAKEVSFPRLKCFLPPWCVCLCVCVFVCVCVCVDDLHLLSEHNTPAPHRDSSLPTIYLLTHPATGMFTVVWSDHGDQDM